MDKKWVCIVGLKMDDDGVFMPDFDDLYVVRTEDISRVDFKKDAELDRYFGLYIKDHDYVEAAEMYYFDYYGETSSKAEALLLEGCRFNGTH